MGTAIAKAEITISRIIDIAGTTRYYLLQSSTASAPSVPADNPPGGNWVTTEPTYTTGSTNTLYFVDLTEFTNDTYKYSEVSKSSSYEAAKAAYNKAVAAQNTANSAQKDVDKLGDDVSSIETRVLTAETQIEKNNEAISLAATKTEVTEAKNAAIADTDNKLKNYSTTAEMNSALTVKANEITSHVSATYTTKDEFNTRVSSAETRITQTEKDIQLRATTEEMNAAITVAVDGINSEVESLKTKVQWVTDVWVDATAYDQSLWIPFKGNGLPLEHSARISVTAVLNNNCHPSWATHGSGFSVEFEVEDIGNGWGVNTWNQRILADKFSWCNTSPVSYTQLGYGSIPVLYLRGGGKYRVMTSYECNWTGYPDGYTWTSGEYSQSAPTHTSRPTPSGTNLYSDMAEAKSKISQQADSITGVVAKANKNESDIASLKLTSDSFTVRFDTVEGNVDYAIDKATQAQESFDNLEVGGRNLVHNSNIFTAYGGATGVTGSVTSEGYLRIVASAGNQHWYNFSVGTIDTSELKQGDTFTLSFKMRSPDATKIPTIYLASGMGYWSMNGALSSEWSTVWCTQTWQSGLTINWHLGFSGCVGTYEIKNVKIEKGNRPTDWSPSPTNYMAFKKNVGLIIGNLTSGVDDLSKIGRNVRIDSDSVDICLGETILASYRDDEIFLGANSTTSVIDLCSGTGQITASALDAGSEWWQLQLRSQNSINLASGGEIILTTDHANGLGYESHNVFSMGGDVPWGGALEANSWGLWQVSTDMAGYITTSEIDMDQDGIRIQYYDRGDVWPEIRIDKDCISLNARFTSTSAVQVSGDQRFMVNNSRIWGTETDGTQVEIFQAKNSSNNTVIGWGNYNNGRGNTNVYGNEVYIGSAAAGKKTFRPYYHGVDSFTTTFRGAGYVTGSTQGIHFAIPLAKPVIGSPTVSVTSTNGFVLRQGGVYTHGSAYGSSKYTYAKPSSYTASIDSSGNCVLVYAYFSSTNNSCTNNSPIGIDWTGTITFAYG